MIQRNALLIGLLLAVAGLFVGGQIHQDPGGSDSPSVRVILGGDVYSGERMIRHYNREQPPSFVDSLREVMKGADLRLANLEAPITRLDTTPVKKQYVLKQPPRASLPILTAMGLDGVSLANNHVMDFGAQGLNDTKQALEEVGIQYAGAGGNRGKAQRAAFFRRKGVILGFLSFSNTFPRSYWAGDTTPGTAYGYVQEIERRVQSVSRRTDYVLVSFHWGTERDTTPKEYQSTLAHRAIDAGADVVFGHHPHTLQPVERYREGLIFYSLGNLFFTTLTHNVEHGLLADVRLRPDGPPEARLHLLGVNNYRVRYHPRLLQRAASPSRIARLLRRPGWVRRAVHPAGSTRGRSRTASSQNASLP